MLQINRHFIHSDPFTDDPTGVCERASNGRKWRPRGIKSWAYDTWLKATPLLNHSPLARLDKPDQHLHIFASVLL